MGTRHLIAVQIDGDYKVAQYGQWDGYPSGQGVDVLAFLRGMERAEFMAKVRAATFAEQADLVALGDQWLRKYPHQSSDVGSEILGVIAKASPGIVLRNSIDFAADSLFCEFAYVIDFDKEVLEIYKGFNKEPVPEGERFHGATTDDKFASKEYQPVRFLKSYPLSALPTDEAFVTDLEPQEEEA